MGGCLVIAVQLELFHPKPPKPAATDWGVYVNEVRIFATGLGTDWWMAFTARFEATPRMTCLSLTPSGGEWHVMCGPKDDAESLAEHMVSFGGVPQSAAKAMRLSARRPKGAW